MTVDTMRAVLLTGHGGPEMLEYCEDFPVPEAGSGEVLIQVGACGVNNTDLWVREGAYGSRDGSTDAATFSASGVSFPLVQGADIVGRIVAVGPGVDPARIGQRVMVDFGIYDSEDPDDPSVDYIGHGRAGGFAEYTAVPAANAHAVETELGDAELATFCCAYVTAERMLERARVGKGDRVLVTGASGGVGSAVIQLCRARDAVPYAVAGDGKDQAVLSIGAEAVIRRGTAKLQQEITDATGGADLDVAVDVVAGSALRDIIEVLKPHGRYVTCGAIANPVVELDMRRIYLKHLSIMGSSQGSRRNFARVRDYVLTGAIKPLLAQTYPLARIGLAQERFVRKDFVGKLVIVT
jgi:NADPH:quinone reductase-like Zn-dependent oxidoreductase